jgi:hypothetical protein
LASIRFTDAIGTATVSNGLDAIAGGVGSRFAGWVPFQRPIGAVATALGTGARSMFRFRTDYGAGFQMRDIETTALPEVLRLMEHLESGGTCAVFTEDAYGRSYASCCLAPGAETQLEMANNTDLTYTLSLTLINLGAVPMLCDYSPVIGPASILFDWDVSRGVTGGTFSRASAATFVTRNA